MKTGLRLAALALIAAALVGIYFLVPKDTEPTATGILYTFPAGDRLEQMRIINQRGEVLFTRDHSKWVITQPGSYRANQQKAKVMESFLLELPIKRELESAAPEYGLDSPQATIEILSASGIRKVLFVGNPTASKAQVYLKDGNSGKIFVTDLGSVTQFDGSLEAYREKDIFSVDKNNIVQFSFYLDGAKQITVQRSSTLDWQMTYPYKSPARKIEISEFLIGLRKWTAIMYPDRAKLDYQVMGLDHPRQALEVVDAKGQNQRLEFGAVAEGVMFVRTGSQEDVAGIFAVDVDFSQLVAANLMFFEPLQTTIDRVARIELTAADRSVMFELDHSTQPPRITSGSKLIPYEAFVSFFVKYITLSADGYDGAAKPGAQTLALKTTYLDGRAAQVRLLAREDGGQYLQVEDQATFYLSDEGVMLLLDRLDAALAAGQ